MNKNKETTEEENLFSDVDLNKKTPKKDRAGAKPPIGTINHSYISTSKDGRRKASSNLTKRNIQLATKVNELTYEKIKTAARVEGRHVVFILEKAIDEYWEKYHSNTKLENLD